MHFLAIIGFLLVSSISFAGQGSARPTRYPIVVENACKIPYDYTKAEVSSAISSGACKDSSILVLSTFSGISNVVYFCDLHATATIDRTVICEIKRNKP